MKNIIPALSLLIIVLAICLYTASCKKNDTAPNPILGNWTMTAYIHDDINVYNTQVPPCATDDIITFANNGQLTADEGPTKCNVSDPQISTATYTLDNNNTQLIVSYVDGSMDTNYIKTLSSTTLKIEQKSNEDLITYTKVE